MFETGAWYENHRVESFWPEIEIEFYVKKRSLSISQGTKSSTAKRSNVNSGFGQPSRIYIGRYVSTLCMQMIPVRGLSSAALHASKAGLSQMAALCQGAIVLEASPPRRVASDHT